MEVKLRPERIKPPLVTHDLHLESSLLPDVEKQLLLQGLFALEVEVLRPCYYVYYLGTHHDRLLV